jgi:hypothetical protein
MTSYELEIGGELTDGLAQAFDGFSVSQRCGRTTLVGDVASTHELTALLARLEELGIGLSRLRQLPSALPTA